MDINDVSLKDVGGSAVDFAKTLNTGEDAAYNDYVMAARAQAKPLDIYSKLEGDAGVPQLRKTASSLSGQVNDLEDTINRVEGNVGATTQNSFVTEGQRQGMVEARKYPLLQQLNPLATSLGRVQGSIDKATADIGTKTNLAMQGNQQELDPMKMRISLMQERSARMMSGFTADREANLNLLLEKIHRNQQLNDQEKQQAIQLAQSQKNYDLELKKLGGDKLDTQVISTGNNSSKLINSQTGQVISSYGSSGGAGKVNTSSYYGGSSSNAWG